LAARPSGENGLRVSTWSPRADRTQDGAVARSPVARRRQGDVGDLEGTTGEVSGKEEGAEAHRSGVPTVRRRKRHRAAVFNGGGVAPVVVDERGGVLQLEGDPGVRRRRSIEEWSSSEGALTGGGGRR
jgi:hypothetical protein